VEKIKKT